MKGIWQDGEKHELADYSVCVQVNYAGAPATTKPIEPVTDANITHAGIAAVRAAHARFAEVGFMGSEQPTETTT